MGKGGGERHGGGLGGLKPVIRELGKNPRTLLICYRGALRRSTVTCSRLRNAAETAVESILGGFMARSANGAAFLPPLSVAPVHRRTGGR